MKLYNGQGKLRKENRKQQKSHYCNPIIKALLSWPTILTTQKKRTVEMSQKDGKMVEYTLLEAHYDFRGLCKNCIYEWNKVPEPSLNDKWKCNIL